MFKTLFGDSFVKRFHDRHHAYQNHLRVFAALSGFVLLAAVAGCRSSFEIHDRPISFSEERIEGTRQYISDRYNIDVDEITIVPQIIVLHWTAIGDFEATFNVFDKETLSGLRPQLAGAGGVNVAAHFLVDRDGSVYRLMPETWMGRHTIGLNYSAIGIENVGGVEGEEDLTRAQEIANIELIRYLKKRYPTIDYLIGHYEYTKFERHPLWLEVDDGYRTVKDDPGPRFMSAVRSGVADLNLLGPPK